MRLLGSGLAATGALWGLYYMHPSGPPGQPDTQDKILLFEIAVTFAFGAVVMLLSRRTWTFRGVGLFLTAIGISVLFSLGLVVAFVGMNQGFYPPGTVIPTSKLDSGVREGITDLGRALLAVGGAILFVGLTFWTIGRYGAKAYVGDVMSTPREYSERFHPGRRQTDPGPVWGEGLEEV